MQGKRAERGGALIQEEISRLILQSVKDPRIGFITVTHVRVSDDLRHARVYVCLPMGPETRRREALIGLKSAAGFLRTELGRRLCLRYAPELHFMLDDSLEEDLRVAKLLREIAADRPTES